MRGDIVEMYGRRSNYITIELFFHEVPYYIQPCKGLPTLYIGILRPGIQPLNAGVHTNFVWVNEN